MSSWLRRVLAGKPGFERDLVERYTERLIQLARQKLPDKVRRRVDPEDVVQSVYRSFFRRLNEGRFQFDDSHDVWRLLAAMTFQKAQLARRFHQQQRRDVRRERPIRSESDGIADEARDLQPGPEDLAILFESLEQLLSRLPPSYRQIAVLRLQGIATDEIAAQVNRSRRTVFRALADLERLAASLLRASE